MFFCFPRLRLRLRLPSFPRTRMRALPNFRVFRITLRRSAREPGARRRTVKRTATVAWKRATRTMRRESRVPTGFDIICTPASSAPTSRQSSAEPEKIRAQDDEEWSLL